MSLPLRTGNYAGPTSDVPDAPLNASAKRWPLLALLTVLYGVGSFGFLAVSPLSPFLLDGFSLTRFQVGLLVPAVYVGGLLLSIPAGRVTDRLGPRACLTGGLSVGGLMLLLAAGAPSFATFLGCLVVTGIGWSLVNPALSRSILELFSVRERGVAMGIKQMGQTAGGIAAALLLPIVAEQWGWRVAIGFGATLVIVVVGLGWRPMAIFRSHKSTGSTVVAPVEDTPWWWLRRTAILVFFGAGFGLGMSQSAFLSYFPLFATQTLGRSNVGAGMLLGLAQAGGAIARLALGAVSDKWLRGRRPPCLVLTSTLTAISFMLFGSALPSPSLVSFAVFCAGAGALGWVGLYMLLSAELGGPKHAGFMTGVGVAFLLAGILLGGPVFGLVLEATDSYTVGWSTFALISGGIGAAVWATGGAIHRECVNPKIHAATSCDATSVTAEDKP